ncbi:MAG: cytochrome c biogenesis protein CcdA [Lentimicrobiaceae bacterium]|nr:cytochrome c biogenesis protein CcdA [Lentimicrobiaceae bacterium]
MQEWINSVISSDQAGIVVLAAVFLLGVISVFTCACNFAVLGVVGGYTGTLSSTGKTKTVVVSSIFFLLGTVIALSAVGCLIGFASELVSQTMGNYWKIGAGIIAILFGIYTLDILPFKIAGITPTFQSKKSGIAGAIIFGFVMGGATSLGSLCCNPIFPVVMGASFLKGSTLWGLAMLFFYALGYGATIAAAMLGVGLGLGKISQLLSKFAVIIKYAGGIMLIAFGFYLLLTI